MPQHIRQAIEGHCEASNVYLVEVRLRGSAKRPIVEVFVDSETGVSLDTCSGISSFVGALLDSDRDFPSSYRLDVSSPGIDRPLTQAWQFRKNVGRLLRIRLLEDEEFKGRLLEVRDSMLLLERGKQGKSRKSDEALKIEIPLTSIQSALVEIEF